MPNSLSQACRYLALFLSVALAGCASLDKYSFETFGRPKRSETYANNARSDELALIYADYVAQLLEGRSTGARVTREISDSSLAVGGAVLAATETLQISAETVAGMGVGAVIIRELQKIFNAGGRSEAFSDAAYLIRQAQGEYRQYNPNPSPDRLTENGAILISRVNAAVHAARKSMNGRMPGLLDLKQATQPMTRDGARRESSGTPQTIFTAAGDSPEQVQAAARRARVDEAVDRRNRGPQVMSQKQMEELIKRQADQKAAEQESRKLELPTPKKFKEELIAVDNAIAPDNKETVYRAIFENAKIDIPNPDLEGLDNVGFNAVTLNEAYSRFPNKQLKIHELVTKQKANPNEPPLPEP